jgi:CRISPR-associated protein Csx3
MNPIQLKLISQKTIEGIPYQLLRINLITGIIEPQDLKNLQLPDSLDNTQGVIIEGKAPIWLYGYLIHQCHATPWVGCYDPRLGGAVIVESHHKGIYSGDIVRIKLPMEIKS